MSLRLSLACTQLFRCVHHGCLLRRAVSMTFLGVVGTHRLLQVAVVGSDWFLSYWSSHTDESTPESTNVGFLGKYAVLCIVSIAVLAVQRVVIALSAVRAARVLHDGLLGNVLRLPMSFFDTTPLGRILNRCVACGVHIFIWGHRCPSGHPLLAC